MSTKKLSQADYCCAIASIVTSQFKEEIREHLARYGVPYNEDTERMIETTSRKRQERVATSINNFIRTEGSFRKERSEKKQKK